MLTVAIHQPQYLPWLAYMDKIDQADVFVYLDTVQYQKNGLQNRNRIHGANGPVMLTVPVNARLSHRICDVRIADGKWRRRHIQSLRQGYARAAHREHVVALSELLTDEWSRLVELNIAVTEWLCAELKITTQRVRASSLGVSSSMHKSDLVIELVKAVGGDRYLSGPGASAYQDPVTFSRAGIVLAYQDYQRTSYAQHGATGFEDALSSVDVVGNAGSGARAILLAGRRDSRDCNDGLDLGARPPRRICL